MNPKIYLIDLAEIAWVSGRLEEAEMYFRRSIRNLPRVYDSYCLLASLLESLDRTSEARSILRRAPEPHGPSQLP